MHASFCRDNLQLHFSFSQFDKKYQHYQPTTPFQNTVSGAICKADAASSQVNFRTALPVTHYPLRPEGVRSLVNWWMVRSPCGKCSCTSNLFHLFWSNYQPRCLWLVDYHCPASLAASPDRHTAISHFNIWSQPPRMSSTQWWGPLWSLGYHGWQKGFILSLPPSPWRVGLMVTQPPNWITET